MQILTPIDLEPGPCKASKNSAMASSGALLSAQSRLMQVCCSFCHVLHMTHYEVCAGLQYSSQESTVTSLHNRVTASRNESFVGGCKATEQHLPLLAEARRALRRQPVQPAEALPYSSDGVNNGYCQDLKLLRRRRRFFAKHAKLNTRISWRALNLRQRPWVQRASYVNAARCRLGSVKKKGPTTTVRPPVDILSLDEDPVIALHDCLLRRLAAKTCIVGICFSRHVWAIGRGEIISDMVPASRRGAMACSAERPR